MHSYIVARQKPHDQGCAVPYLKDRRWQKISSISASTNALRIVTDRPSSGGVYRIITNDDWHYIGRAGSVERRLKEYCRPGYANGSILEWFVRQFLIDGGGGVFEFIECDKGHLNDLENYMISEAKKEHIPLINDIHEPLMVKIKKLISIHSSELKRYRAALKSVDGKIG